MKSTRFMLTLLFVLCTCKIGAQVEKTESFNTLSGNTVYKNIPIVIYSQAIDGFIYVNNQEQSIWQGQNYYEYKMKKVVTSGDIITVEAWILGRGYLNTTTVEVPENFTNPRLEIYVQKDAIPSVGANIIDYY